MVLSTDEEHVHFAALREEFPAAAAAELTRFCRARLNSADEAAQMYRKHVEWQQGPGSKENLLAAALAVPQKFIREAGQALDGTPILFVQGARYDPDIDPETYMLACAHALDSLLPADDDRKVTILVDARPGEGWPNVSAHKMLPFFRLCCSELPDNFPERAQKVVIYPLPGIVRQLWRMVRGLLDPVTREKIELLSGPASIGSPCPAELGDVVLLEQLPLDAHKMHQGLSPR